MQCGRHALSLKDFSSGLRHLKVLNLGCYEGTKWDSRVSPFHNPKSQAPISLY